MDRFQSSGVYRSVLMTCMYVWMYLCMYVCMYVCIYVCMYICMYAYLEEGEGAEGPLSRAHRPSVESRRRVAVGHPNLLVYRISFKSWTIKAKNKASLVFYFLPGVSPRSISSHMTLYWFLTWPVLCSPMVSPSRGRTGHRSNNCHIGTNRFWFNNCHVGTNGFWDNNYHIGTNGFWVINCHIGTNGIDTSVLLGKMELSQLSYWHKWNWLNSHIDTTVVVPTVIVPTVLLSQLSLSQLSLSQLSFGQMSWHHLQMPWHLASGHW